MLPSAGLKAVAHRTNVISLLNNPAHSYRYRRFACPLTGAGARLAEKRGSVRPSYRGTSTPYLLPVRLAHQNRTKPYRDRTLSVQIRTPRRAYARRIRETQTTRVCEVYAETAGVGCEIRLMTGSGVLGARGVGGIQGDAAARVFLDFLEGHEALVNPFIQECGSGTQRPGPQLQAQAGPFAEDLVCRFTGRKVGCLGHGLLHLREGREAGQELPAGGSLPALWTPRPARAAPGRRQAWYTVGQRRKGLPPQSAQRLACRRPYWMAAGPRVLLPIRKSPDGTLLWRIR